jgi:GNAT superfamily N-acetyltransferase
MSDPFTIAAVVSAVDLVDAARLMRAYVASLDVDLAFQDVEAELAGLPGAYAPPAGALLLARHASGVACGCGAIRATGTAGTCEMKRLYVTGDVRGQGIGPALVAALMQAARITGYRRIVLDTLPSMLAAQALYARLGFSVIAPYYDTPVAGTVFMEKWLDAPES